MGSVLVVYGSWAGATAGVAQRVGKTFSMRGARVFVVPASSAPDPGAYDCVVVGSAVHTGEWHPMARAWVTSHAPVLREKPSGFFSVCLTPVVHPLHMAEARGYCLPVSAEAGVHPLDAAAFAGAYDPEKHKLPVRVKARAWGAKPGDFRDWKAIDRWAGSLAHQFGY